jgi:TonB-linked SusC/RagA family outer membrane protein
MRKYLQIIVCIIIIQFSLIQFVSANFSGRVVTAEDRTALSGVWIQLIGTNRACLTDIEGYFSLIYDTESGYESDSKGGSESVSKSDRYRDSNSNFNPDSLFKLRISYLGRQTKVVIAQDSFMLIELDLSTTELREFVKIAYGLSAAKTLTGSVFQLQGSALEQVALSNAIKALDGLVPGLQLSSGGGQPGSGAALLIRGIGSVSASASPLIVLDGLPYNGDLSSLNPSDIAVVSVLKDASAAALYGSRAANGVLLVETKKGQACAPQCRLRTCYGSISRAAASYATMGVKSYMECLLRAYRNKLLAEGIEPAQANAAAVEALSRGPEKIFGLNEQYNPYNLSLESLFDPLNGTIRPEASLQWEENWIKSIEARAPVVRKYSFDLQGGTEKLRYRMSLSWLDEQGLLTSTGFKRLTGCNSLEVQPASWISTSMSVRFAQKKYRSLGAQAQALSNIWYSALMMGPIFPVYQRDPGNGEQLEDEQGNLMFDYGEQRPAGQQQHFNSVALLYKDEYSSSIDDLGLGMELNLGSKTPGALLFSMQLATDQNRREDCMYLNPKAGNAVLSQGRLNVQHQNELTYSFNQQLKQQLFWKKHSLNWFLAHEFYKAEYSHINAYKTGFASEKLRELDAAAVVDDCGGSSESHGIDSYMARLNYQYDDRFYLSASYRRDASSRFHSSRRRGNFWSIGINYPLSETASMKNSEVVDHMALRAGYGVQGNEALLNAESRPNYYAWQNLLDYSYSNASQSGALWLDLADPEISWESCKNFNLAYDLAVLNRFQLTLDAYMRINEDILLWFPMAPSTGFSGYNKNTGRMLNSGFELYFKAQLLKQGPFLWQSSFSASSNRNLVLALSDQNRDINLGHQIIRVGEPIYSFYLCRSAGVDPADGAQLYWACFDEKANPVEPYITKDLNFALMSRKIAGNRSPLFYGALQQMFSFRKVDLTMQINYSLGGKIMDKIYLDMLSFRNPAQAKHSDLEQAWKQAGDEAELPRYEVGKTYQMTDQFLIDASYLSLKQLSLVYNFTLKKLPQLKDCSLTLSAENLFIFSHLRGMDPQYDFIGLTEYAYVPVRTISLQLACNF